MEQNNPNESELCISQDLYPGDTVVKTYMCANAEDARDPGSIPESGRAPRVKKKKKKATHFRILG